MYIKHLTHSLAQNKPPNYYYYLELQKLSVHFTTLEVKVFPSANQGLDSTSQFCSPTSLQFFWLSWPLEAFFSPNNHLHLHSTFNFEFFHIYYLFDSYHHSEASGKDRQYYSHLTGEENDILRGCNLPNVGLQNQTRET